MRRLMVIALGFALLASPAAAEHGDVVELPPRGETRLAVLDLGDRVWVVHHEDGEIDVLGVAAERLDPDADPFVYGSSFDGIRSFTFWSVTERIFFGGGAQFDDSGMAISWSPNQIDGAEDAGSVPARDLTAYATERVDDDRVRVGAPSRGEVRMVPPGGSGLFADEEILRSVERDEETLTLEEALDLPVGTTALVETDVEVAGERAPRLCDLPRVPVPDIPPCPEDAPVPVGVTARDPRRDVAEVEYGPHLLTRLEDGLAGLVNGGGRSGAVLQSDKPSFGFDDDPGTLDRIEADDPVALAVEISRTRFPAGGGAEAILVRSDDPADATTASALTGQAPLLFTGRDSLPEGTRRELGRVLTAAETAPTVVVVGGESAIRPAVVSQLEGAGYRVERAAGPTRVETAIAVAERARFGSESIISPVLLARAYGSPDDPSAAWADSVTAGAYAAIFRTPILLTPSDALHPAVADALGQFRTSETVLLGGTAALSNAVEQSVPGARRIAGANRAGTAAAIASELWTFTSGRAVLFDGAAPDGWQAGLAASGLAANAFAPLLIAGETLPSETTKAIRSLCPYRGGDLLAVGEVRLDPTTPCDPAAPPQIQVVVAVDSRSDTEEEDARVTVELHNDGDVPVTVTRYQISDESTDASATVYAPVVGDEVEPQRVDPGVSRSVVTVDPLTVSRLNAGGTSAGRYQAAVLTDRGWARATFYVEFSTPFGS